ncbi:hypothetical protein Bca4012_008181 [Brassica carinata]|uniref:SWIM-type domain-containing protein n=1 Tax=Brassica oleracea var. oleracea TaxID=109376 RepID=A0A0D3BMV5_BRAOL
MPFVEMLETMRRLVMWCIDLWKNKMKNHKGKFSLNVNKMIESKTIFREHCKSLPGLTGEYEVTENGMKYAVDMRVRTCSCRRLVLTGIPRRHAVCVVLDKKKTYKTDNLVSHWYLTFKWQQQYLESIKQGANESPSKGKKVTQHARVMHCSLCGLPEHNSSKFPNSRVLCKLQPAKKQKNMRSEEIAVDSAEGATETHLSQP